MDSLFRKYNFCIVYINDILITSENMIEHIRHLERVFKIIELFKSYKDLY